MTTATKPLPPHGSLSRHKYHRCKCDTCRQAYRAYQNTRHRHRGYGTWEPFVDAEPVRQHLLALNRTGLSYALIAQRAGLHTATVTGFIYDLGSKRPRKKRARHEIAAKILAVTDSTVTPGMVDATGTRRRLQALAAIGWPMRPLGAYIGVAGATVGRLTAQHRVYSRTALAVASCYDELRSQSPETHGIEPWVVTKTRKWAARNRWPDPLWWDDMGHIDDPTFDPAKAEDGSGASKRDEVEHLARFGISEPEICDRTGASAPYVRQIVTELRSGQRRARTKGAA